MESVQSPSISKILLDYTEYERLKHIESLYIELQRHQSIHKVSQKGLGENVTDNTIVEEDDDDKSTTSTLSDQMGAGLIPPTATFEPKLETLDSSPLKHYNANVIKSDLNSVFDEKELLKKVPKNYLDNAKHLLEEFDKRGQELTWNSSGTIFINQIALPLSNIYVLFPLLFKKKGLIKPGFENFVQKIYDMGLGSLIVHDRFIKQLEENKITGSGENITHKVEEVNNTVPWWYIGD